MSLGFNINDNATTFSTEATSSNQSFSTDFSTSKETFKVDLRTKSEVNGASAYEIAVANGFEGTETEWLESLKGGNGNNGSDGNDGLSAYQIALNNGFEGSEAEWIASLKGADGKNGKDGNTPQKNVDYFDGDDGKSAYQYALDGGFTGTEADFVALLNQIDNKANKATTLEGYGITDAYTNAKVDAALSGKADKIHSHVIADVSGLQSALDGKAASSHGTHVFYSTTAPVMDGTASVGVAGTVARSDHKHPTDTTRAAQTALDTHTSNTTVHITADERTIWNAASALANTAKNAAATAQATADGKADTEHAHTVDNISDLTATVTELNYVGGVTSNIQAQLDSKTNKSDIATTAMQGTASGSDTYWKIANFGNWGTGNWTQKGFSMIITSRAGELVWVSLAANDSNTSAGAIRLINRYSKIKALYYSVSESAIYVNAAAWANNICAHIISNVNGDYVPTVANASALPADAVEINIVEVGINSTSAVVGNSSVKLEMGGSADRPTYNNADMALYSDITSLDTRLSTLEAAAVSVFSGTEAAMTADVGEDGDIYLVTE